MPLTVVKPHNNTPLSADHHHHHSGLAMNSQHSNPKHALIAKGIIAIASIASLMYFVGRWDAYKFCSAVASPAQMNSCLGNYKKAK